MKMDEDSAGMAVTDIQAQDEQNDRNLISRQSTSVRRLIKLLVFMAPLALFSLAILISLVFWVTTDVTIGKVVIYLAIGGGVLSILIAFSIPE